MKVEVGDLVRDKMNGAIGLVFRVGDQRAWTYWSDDHEPQVFWLEQFSSLHVEKL